MLRNRKPALPRRAHCLRTALAFLVAVSLYATTASAQGIRYDNVVQTSTTVTSGQTVTTPAAGVTITACATAPIAAVSEVGTVVTVTTSVAHGLVAGQPIQIVGVGLAGYNGTFIVATTPTSTTFTYVNTTSGLASSTGGTELPNNVPCTPLATVYADQSLSNTASNPTTSDALGNYGFWLAPGTYVFSLSGGAISPSFYTVTAQPSAVDTVSNQTIGGNKTFTGNLTLQGTVLASGPFTALNPCAIDGLLFVSTGGCYTTIAAALAAVPSMGASVVVLPTGYRETFTSHFDLGDGLLNAVLLMMPDDVIVTCNVSDSSYCFKVHEGGGVMGLRNQAINTNRGGGAIISIASTANITNVVQTGENPQGSITLSGFDIDNVNGGAVSNAFVNLVNLNDASTIRDISGFYFPHIGINISATTGGVKSIGPLNIDNCYFDGVQKTGARPLVIQSDGAGATNNVNVMGGYYINPGSSLADIEINGGGGTTGALQQILISGVYTQQAAPSTAVTGIKIVDAAGVTVQTSSFQVTDGTTGHTGISVNQSGAGRTHSINVQNFRLDAAGGNIGLNNLITTTTVLNGVGSGNIPGYIYGGSTGTQTPSPFIFDDVQVTINGNNVRQTIGAGTSTSNGTAIAAGTAQAQPAITITGATTSDVATCSLNGATPATWQTGIVPLLPEVTANTVTLRLSNPTAGSITPAATAFRCSVSR